MSIITKLDAINTCLRGIGVAPVATEDDPDLDAATALQQVEDASHYLQSKGWWFNTESNWKLTPDPITGYINAPPSALSIITSGDSRELSLTIRGSKIYDLYNHTFDLSSLTSTDSSTNISYINFTFITELEWDDLPPIAKRAITYAARRLFAQDLEVDERRWKFQKQDEFDAYNALLLEHTRNTKTNSIRDNARVSSFLRMAGGPNVVNYSPLGFPKSQS